MGFRDGGSGCGVSSMGLVVQGLGFGVWSLGFGEFGGLVVWWFEV